MPKNDKTKLKMPGEKGESDLAAPKCCHRSVEITKILSTLCKVRPSRYGTVSITSEAEFVLRLIVDAMEAQHIWYQARYVLKIRHFSSLLMVISLH